MRVVLDNVVCGERKKGVATFELAPDYSSVQNAKDRKGIMTIKGMVIKIGLLVLFLLSPISWKQGSQEWWYLRLCGTASWSHGREGGCW